MTNDELNVIQSIRKAAGVGCKPMLYDMPGIVRDLKIGHDRYETVRLLNPRQFAELYDKNIKTGIPFDALVDQMSNAVLSGKPPHTEL